MGVISSSDWPSLFGSSSLIYFSKAFVCIFTVLVLCVACIFTVFVLCVSLLSLFSVQSVSLLSLFSVQSAFYCSCSLCSLHLYCSCSLCSLYLYCSCSLHSLYLYCSCSLCSLHLYSSCSVCDRGSHFQDHPTNEAKYGLEREFPKDGSSPIRAVFHQCFIRCFLIIGKLLADCCLKSVQKAP